MGILSTAVAQMIASMEPAERRQAILEVTGQALALMDAADRLTLTRQLLVSLIESLAPDDRAGLARDAATALTQGD